MDAFLPGLRAVGVVVGAMNLTSLPGARFRRFRRLGHLGRGLQLLPKLDFFERRAWLLLRARQRGAERVALCSMRLLQLTDRRGDGLVVLRLERQGVRLVRGDALVERRGNFGALALKRRGALLQRREVRFDRTRDCFFVLCRQRGD